MTARTPDTAHSFGVVALAFWLCLLSSSSHALQGFDPNAKPVPDFELTPFYDADLDFATKAPGEILKTEPIAAPAGALAWRVMYVSRTWDDRLVPVTGIIVAPQGHSARPRPILCWLHGTTGGARVAAPSLAPNPAQDLVQRSESAPIDYGVPYLTDLLAKGYVVVATDYYGLGGPGVHQYIVGSTAARNGLDIARAARRLEDTHAGRELLTFGWSQGGHGGLFLAEEQPAYAPEFNHKGVVAVAPGTTAGVHFMNIPHAYVLARGYNSAYYVPLTGFTDEGRKLIDVAGNVSITGVFRESLKYQGPFFVGDWNPAMKAALALNIPGNRKSPAPVLVVHGTTDEVAPPAGTKEMLPRALKNGDTIKVSWYPNEGHRSVFAAARPEILAWFDDRLRGRPATSEEPQSQAGER
jgi:pimeloyl-ACP methyl ester carboxylesterase